MGKMKYVIIRSNGVLKPILFDPLLEHSMFANHKVESAGFVSIHTEKYKVEIQVSVWGESITLDMISAPVDADIIRRVLTRDY